MTSKELSDGLAEGTQFSPFRLLPHYSPSRQQPPLGQGEWKGTMKRALALAVALGLGMAAGTPAQSQGYLVNGHAASKAEVELLGSYGARPGRWVVDGYGMSLAGNGLNTGQQASGNGGQKCWYVLDVQLCD
jgi:hypothetical protein